MPEAACSERFSNAPESTMLPSEAAAIANAVTERRREFGTVRQCAREALLKIGVPATPILPDADRAPRWPAGVVGSMTHCAGYRGAAVARSSQLRTLGIDAEPHAALPATAHDLVLRAEERGQLGSLADTDAELHWDRIHFCAKEAAYKAWFPLTRRRLEFCDVSTLVCPDGMFEANVLVRDGRSPNTDLDALTGRWAVAHGLVVAATWVAP